METYLSKYARGDTNYKCYCIVTSSKWKSDSMEESTSWGIFLQTTYINITWNCENAPWLLSINIEISSQRNVLFQKSVSSFWWFQMYKNPFPRENPDLLIFVNSHRQHLNTFITNLGICVSFHQDWFEHIVFLGLSISKSGNGDFTAMCLWLFWTNFKEGFNEILNSTTFELR